MVLQRTLKVFFFQRSKRLLVKNSRFVYICNYVSEKFLDFVQSLTQIFWNFTKNFILSCNQNCVIAKM